MGLQVFACGLSHESLQYAAANPNCKLVQRAEGLDSAAKATGVIAILGVALFVGGAIAGGCILNADSHSLLGRNILVAGLVGGFGITAVAGTLNGIMNDKLDSLDKEMKKIQEKKDQESKAPSPLLNS